MHRVAGQEHASPAVMVGEQQVLLPLADVEHLVLHRNADGALQLPGHVRVALGDRVQRPVPGRVLHDQEGRTVVGDVIVAAFPRAVAERDPVEQLVAAVERLAQPQQSALAAQRDAELLAHGARAAIAADEVGGAELENPAIGAHVRGDAGPILLERQEIAAVAHAHAWQRLGHGFQQRLEGVLRDQLIRLERQGTVGAGVDAAALRPPTDREGAAAAARSAPGDDEHVHRHFAAPSPAARMFCASPSRR